VLKQILTRQPNNRQSSHHNDKSQKQFENLLPEISFCASCAQNSPAITRTQTHDEANHSSYNTANKLTNKKQKYDKGISEGH
jgi:hypothetical protein